MQRNGPCSAFVLRWCAAHCSSVEAQICRSHDCAAKNGAIWYLGVHLPFSFVMAFDIAHLAFDILMAFSVFGGSFLFTHFVYPSLAALRRAAPRIEPAHYSGLLKCKNTIARAKG